MTIIVGVSAADGQHEPLREAVRLAAGLGEPLHVVHVRPEATFEETANGGGDPDAPPTFGAVRAEAAEIASAAFERAHDDVAEDDEGSADGEREPPAVEFVGAVGKPATGLVDHAEHVDASLIVVGGRRRSPVGKAVFGSVAQDVLLEAERPVVACLDDET